MGNDDNIDVSELVEKISPIVDHINQLAQSAVPGYRQQVRSLIASGTKDSNKVCYQLDFLLDLAFNDDILALYKELCRYLYTFDQQATVDYVNYYREQYDDEYQREHCDDAE